MTVEPKKKTFGSYLAFHRYQTRCETGKHLSQSKFADEINLIDPTLVFNNDTVYKWEKDIRKFHPEDRNTLITILKVLVKFEGVKSIGEANTLVNLSGLKALDEKEIDSLHFTAFDLLPVLRESLPAENPSQPKNLGGGYKRGIDPLNFSRVDTFYRSPPKTDSDLIQTEDRSLNPFENALIMEEKPPYQKEALLPVKMPPPTPNLFVGRDEALVELRERVCHSDDGQVNLQVLTAMQEAAGMGKTALASALASDETVLKRFPDGVLWAFLGPHPAIFPSLVSWGKTLGICNIGTAKSPAEAAVILKAYLHEKKMLLIIDDACNAADAFSFMVGGAGCAELVITSLTEVALNLTDHPNQIYYLDKLNENAAFTILQALAPDVTDQYPKEVHDLIEKLEGLPLALQLVGRMLQFEFNLGFNIANMINELGRQGSSNPSRPAAGTQANFSLPSISTMLYQSLNHLDESDQKCYALLGASNPSPAQFDEKKAALLWQVEDPRPLLKRLIDLGLLDYLPQQQLYQMHALQLMLAQSLWKEKYSSG